MDNLAFFVEHNKYWIAKAAAVIQSLHQSSILLLLNYVVRLTRFVVYMNILKVIIDNLADCGIVCDEISKEQAPRAPVATNLTNYKLTL